MKRVPVKTTRLTSIPKPVEEGGGSRMICKGGCGEEFSAEWLKWRGGVCKECELQKQIDYLSSRCTQLEKEVAELKEDIPTVYKRYKHDKEQERQRMMMFVGVAKNPASLEDATKNFPDPRE
jgi:hypothetical protein